MKIVISGGRDISNYDLIKEAILESGFSIDCIIHGDMSGVDKLGKRYAKERGVPEVPFPANWTEHGKAAGPIRNSEMINFVKDEEAGLVAVWDGRSKGTWDCIRKAYAAGLHVFVKCVGTRKKS
jgi:hypothetical protein